MAVRGTCFCSSSGFHSFGIWHFVNDCWILKQTEAKLWC